MKRTTRAQEIFIFVAAVALRINVANAQCSGGPQVCGQWVAVPPCNYPIGSPCEGGRWPAGLHAGHVILTRGAGPPYAELGKLLIFHDTTGSADPEISTLAHYWDPRTPGTADPTGVLAANHPNRTLFCSGHVVLPDGRVMVAGGHDNAAPPALRPAGNEDVYVFDPVAFAQSGTGWQLQAQLMQTKRYYPTLTLLQDARVISSSGQIDLAAGLAQSVEDFDRNVWEIVNSSADFSGTYPFMHVLPGASIRVLHSGPRDSDLDVLEGLESGSPWWNEHRFGDSQTAFGVTTTEIFTPPANPQTEQGQWREVAPMDHHSPPIPRMYHSTAALLPDGRVLVAGGDGEDNCPQPPGHGIPATDECLSADFYEPPYLFTSTGNPIQSTYRPLIEAYPELVGTGTKFTVTVVPHGSQLTACLIRPTATTHGNDMDQRRVPLSITALGGSQYEVTAPTTLSDAPPGDYLLFFMNDAGLNGHPSVAKFVNVWRVIRIVRERMKYYKERGRHSTLGNQASVAYA